MQISIDWMNNHQQLSNSVYVFWAWVLLIKAISISPFKGNEGNVGVCILGSNKRILLCVPS